MDWMSNPAYQSEHRKPVEEKGPTEKERLAQEAQAKRMVRGASLLLRRLSLIGAGLCHVKGEPLGCGAVYRATEASAQLAALLSTCRKRREGRCRHIPVMSDASAE